MVNMYFIDQNNAKKYDKFVPNTTKNKSKGKPIPSKTANENKKIINNEKKSKAIL